MKTKLLRVWERPQASFWFVPTLMTVTAVALSVAMIALDEAVKEKIPLGGIWTGGAEGAREMLSAIAGSMIGIAGVTLSLRVLHSARRSSRRQKQEAPGFRVSRCSPGMTGVSFSSFPRKRESRGCGAGWAFCF